MIEPGTISVVTISEIRGAARAALRRAFWAAERRMSSAMSLSASDSGTPSSSACSWAPMNVDSDSDWLRVAQGEERVAARRAEVHLAQRDQDLLARRAAERLGHALQRRAVAEARAHRHREDVEEVRQVALDPLLAQAAGAREQDVGPEPAHGHGDEGDQPRAADQREEAEDGAAQQRERALEADEALHGQAAGAPGEVEPARDRLAAAEADPGRQARAEASREPLDQAPDQRAAAARGLDAGARGEPVDRPAVEQQRHRQQRAGEAEDDERAREQRRHTSTFVVARISTNATAHSVPAAPSASRPASEDVISRMTPGVSTFIITIAAMPMPATM